MTTRRSFLKGQLALCSSLLLASSFDGLAKATKIVNIKDNKGILNLMCCADVGHLKHYVHSIKNFELSSINLFAGSIAVSPQLGELLYGLEAANYHAINFSWQKGQTSINDLVKVIGNASLSFVNCNYAFESKRLQELILPYIIIHHGSTKIGITGIGAQTDEKGISCKNPIVSLNKVAQHLKEQEHCDKVICLADLGFDKQAAINNLKLAQATSNVQLVVGAGENPKGATAWSLRNSAKDEVLVSANQNTHRYTNLLQFNFNQNQSLIFNTKNI